jgi:hypothetical protein
MSFGSLVSELNTPIVTRQQHAGGAIQIEIQGVCLSDRVVMEI